MVSELVKSLFGELESRVTPENEEFIAILNKLFPEHTLPYDIPAKEILLTALFHGCNNFEDLFNQYKGRVLLKENLLKTNKLTPEERIVFEKSILQTKYIAGILIAYTL